jgi:hypothetical protein
MVPRTTELAVLTGRRRWLSATQVLLLLALRGQLEAILLAVVFQIWIW